MFSRRQFLTGLAGLAMSGASVAKSKINARYQAHIRIGIYPGELENGALYATIVGNYEPFIDHLRANGFQDMTYLIETAKAAWPQHLVRESYDFVYLPPQMAVTARQLGYTPLARSETSIQPVFACNESSKLHSISDLAGAKARVLVKEDTVGALVAKYTLMKSGVIEKVSLLDAGSVDQNWLPEAAKQGLTDVVAIQNGIDFKQAGLRAIHECPSLPGFVWLAGRKVGPEAVEMFQRSLSNFNSGAKGMESAGIALGVGTKGFSPLTDADIAHIRTIVYSGVERFKATRV